MPEKKHIFLCGFMGSGKSTHGKKLAGILKKSFFDLDIYIQGKEHKTIQFIFENEGETEFRILESKYLNELLLEQPPAVISLGGGTVCFNDNLKKIKENGILIYIEMPAAALAERLNQSKQKRPLLKNVEVENLNTFIQEKLNERNVFYKQAHITVDGLNLNRLQLHQLILEYNNQNNG